MKKIFSILIIAIILSGGLFLDAPLANACSCLDSGPMGVYAGAEVVFSGRVLSVSELDENDPRFLPYEKYFTGRFTGEPPTNTIFEFKKIWKGDAALVSDKPQGVLSVYNGASCTGYYFKEGRDYLVFANLAEDGRVMQTNLCSGTRSLEYAEEYLNYLESPTASNDPVAGYIDTLPSPIITTVIDEGANNLAPQPNSVSTAQAGTEANQKGTTILLAALFIVSIAVIVAHRPQL
jgi:hypothetical protein